MELWTTVSGMNHFVGINQFEKKSFGSADLTIFKRSRQAKDQFSSELIEILCNYSLRKNELNIFIRKILIRFCLTWDSLSSQHFIRRIQKLPSHRYPYRPFNYLRLKQFTSNYDRTDLNSSPLNKNKSRKKLQTHPRINNNR